LSISLILFVEVLLPTSNFRPAYHARNSSVISVSAICQSDVTECQDKLRLNGYFVKDYANKWKTSSAADDARRIEQKMNELARRYAETNDKTMVEELYKLACELQKMESEKKD
jgi:hypothetical protein